MDHPLLLVEIVSRSADSGASGKAIKAYLTPESTRSSCTALKTPIRPTVHTDVFLSNFLVYSTLIVSVNISYYIPAIVVVTKDVKSSI